MASSDVKKLAGEKHLHVCKYLKASRKPKLNFHNDRNVVFNLQKNLHAYLKDASFCSLLSVPYQHNLLTAGSVEPFQTAEGSQARERESQ